MSALRVARGFTGRSLVVKFAGCYHGHGDLLLAEAGSGVATLGLPGSAGVPPTARSRDTEVVPYNVVPELDRRRRVRDRRAGRREHGPRRAGAGLPRRAARRVRPRRRAAHLRRGHHRLPRRRRAARRRLRRHARPDVLRQGDRRRPPGRRRRRPAPTSWTCSRRSGPCTRRARCRGTRSRPPPGSPRSSCSTTPPYATLAAPRRTARRRAREGARAPPGIAAVRAVGRPARRAVLRRRPAVDYDTRARRPTSSAYARFFHALLDRGVAIAPGAYEVLFPGLAHTDDVIDEIVAAADAAAAL